MAQNTVLGDGYQTVSVVQAGQAYDVLIGPKTLEVGMQALKQRFAKATQVLVIQQQCDALQAESKAIQALLETLGLKATVLELPATETSKTLASVEHIYNALLENRFTRHDVCLAVGGGIMGDMTGFAAATYLRGIGFVQCPTTLLAMVDASVGGKTGVNHGAYKNMVGAFYPPQLVVMNTSVLATLPQNELACGMAEVVKTAMLQNSIPNGTSLPSLWQQLQQLVWPCSTEALQAIIANCVQLKAWVVQADPNETKGIRDLLNLGHTYGHAIEHELAGQILHGQAVAIGLVLATQKAVQLQMMPESTVNELIVVLSKFELPTSVPNGVSQTALIAAMGQDKKRQQGGTIRLILPFDEFGHAKVVDTTLTE